MVTTTIGFTRTDYTFRLNPRDHWLSALRLDGITALGAPVHQGNIQLSPGDRPRAVDVRHCGAVMSGRRVDVEVVYIKGSGRPGSFCAEYLYVVYLLGPEGLECKGVYASTAAPGTDFMYLYPALIAAGVYDA